MATVTLTPDKYWQCDYGYITAMNPGTLHFTGKSSSIEKTNIESQRAAFTEIDIPANAAYRHGVPSQTVIRITGPAFPSYNAGYYIVSNSDVDLQLSVGKNIVSAGSEVLNYYSYVSPNQDITFGESVFYRAANGKMYFGFVATDTNTATSVTFTITYSDGNFAVTPSIAGGYIPSTVATTIALTAVFIPNMIMQYTVASGVFYYKKTSELNYSSIPFSGSSVVIPANTLEENETYDYYFTAVSDDGKTTTTDTYTAATGDLVGTVTAVSPSNVVAYGRPAFTWLYENELGNLQTAFDLQVSMDGSIWVDVATHEVSSETAYTTNVALGGLLYWRVRSYNQADVASDWSNVLSFTNVLPPSAPTITGVSGTGRITVSWNSSNQIAYQIKIGDYDSGWVYSTNKSHFLNEYLPDGLYEIRVRVTNNIGLASEWATMSYSQSGSVAGPTASIEMKEGYNEITISGSFEKYYIIRNGVVVAETSDGTYDDYFCNDVDNYVVRGVNLDDTFGDSVLTGRYNCRKPALITPDASIYYVNERLDEQPSISSSNTLDVATVEYLGRTKPVHHVGQMNVRTWAVTCSNKPVPGQIYFYRNFRGDKAWVICSNVQSVLNFRGVHEYQFTLEETDYDEAVEYEI